MCILVGFWRKDSASLLERVFVSLSGTTVWCMWLTTLISFMRYLPYWNRHETKAVLWKLNMMRLLLKVYLTPSPWPVFISNLTDSQRNTNKSTEFLKKYYWALGKILRKTCFFALLLHCFPTPFEIHFEFFLLFHTRTKDFFSKPMQPGEIH